MQFAVDDFLAGAFDTLEHLGREVSTFVVGAGRGQFDHRQGLDEIRILADGHPGDVEVLDRSLGLDAVVRLSRHRFFAEQIVFDALVGHGGASLVAIGAL